jgi:hypothetical protein
MSFGNETSGWIYNPFSAVCVVSTVNELSGLADGAQSNGLVSDQFVGGETVMKLDD